MFILPDLPYAAGALAPTLSAATLETHHGKHHRKYVEVLNDLLAEKGERPESLEAVVASAPPGKLFNNAAQSWNHGFFWECMTPDGGGGPEGELRAAIEADLGGLDTFREAFVTEGATHFASGWVWLVDQGGRLKVISTHDAGCPLADGSGAPILVCDVWEHAYYLDHRQDRKGFLEAWFDRLANWSFAGEQLAAARAGRPGWRYPAPT